MSIDIVLVLKRILENRNLVFIPTFASCGIKFLMSQDIITHIIIHYINRLY